MPMPRPGASQLCLEDSGLFLAKAHEHTRGCVVLVVHGLVVPWLLQEVPGSWRLPRWGPNNRSTVRGALESSPRYPPHTQAPQKSIVVGIPGGFGAPLRVFRGDRGSGRFVESKWGVAELQR